MSRFYDYRQNNSGGGFDIDESRGISINVIIEADSVDDANDRAERIGLYFNGCDDGSDCPCCGDRWSPFWGYGETVNGAEVPSIYETPLIDFPVEGGLSFGPMRWAGDKADAYVHLKSGEFYGFVLTESGQYVYDGKNGAIPEALPSAEVKAIES